MISLRQPSGSVTHCIASLLFLGLAAPAAALGGFDCLLEPHTVVDVSTREHGVIASMSVTRGDLVEPGQALAKLESEVETAAVALAQARADASSRIEAQQLRIKFGRRQRKRAEDLHQRKAMPFNEMDRIRTDASLAEFLLKELKEETELAGLALAQAQATLARRTVRSPVRGVVMRRLASPGESIENQPLVRVAQLDPLNVEIIVPSESLGQITKDMTARVTPVLPGAAGYRATVVVADRIVDAASGTFGVRLELPNPDYAVPSGVRCDIEFD